MRYRVRVWRTITQAQEVEVEADSVALAQENAHAAADEGPSTNWEHVCTRGVGVYDVEEIEEEGTDG